MAKADNTNMIIPLGILGAGVYILSKWSNPIEKVGGVLSDTIGSAGGLIQDTANTGGSVIKTTGGFLEDTINTGGSIIKPIKTIFDGANEGVERFFEYARGGISEDKKLENFKNKAINTINIAKSTGLTPNQVLIRQERGLPLTNNNNILEKAIKLKRSSGSSGSSKRENKPISVNSSRSSIKKIPKISLKTKVNIASSKSLSSSIPTTRKKLLGF